LHLPRNRQLLVHIDETPRQLALAAAVGAGILAGLAQRVEGTVVLVTVLLTAAMLVALAQQTLP
jgi:hypothetical protein